MLKFKFTKTSVDKLFMSKAIMLKICKFTNKIKIISVILTIIFKKFNFIFK